MDSDSLIERASAALELGRDAEAASLASQAIAKDPEKADGHVMLAWALLHGDDDAALASAQRAIALAPNNPDGFDVGATAAGRSGNKALAIELATRYREMLPQSARSHRRYAETLVFYGKNKQKHEALESANEAVRLSPNNSANWNALGKVQYYSFNKPKEARVSFEKALECDPLDSSAKQMLADTSEDAGDKGTAMSLVQSVIRLDPTNQHARRQLDDIIIGFMSDVLWATFVVAIVVFFVLAIAFGGAS